MADVGSITIDKRSFNRAMKNLGSKYKVTAKRVIFDQHRQHTQDWINFTPPKRLRDGKWRISSDIDKVFIALDKQQVLDFYAENFGKKPKSTGKKVKQSVRPLEAEGIYFNWNGDKNQMRRFHESHRTGRQRGVRFRSRKIPVGNFEFGTGMYAKDTKIKAYKRERFKDIGKLKFAWDEPASKFNAKIPTWVSSRGKKRGKAKNAYSREKAQGSLISINDISWASNRMKGFDSAIKRRRQTALKKHFKRQLEIAAKNWSRSKNG